MLYSNQAMLQFSSFVNEVLKVGWNCTNWASNTIENNNSKMLLIKTTWLLKSNLGSAKAYREFNVVFSLICLNFVDERSLVGKEWIWRFAAIAMPLLLMYALSRMFLKGQSNTFPYIQTNFNLNVMPGHFNPGLWELDLGIYQARTLRLSDGFT